MTKKDLLRELEAERFGTPVRELPNPYREDLRELIGVIVRALQEDGEIDDSVLGRKALG